MDMNKDIELYWSGVLSVTHESVGVQFDETRRGGRQTDM
jgi:hypothetical protein